MTVSLACCRSPICRSSAAQHGVRRHMNTFRRSLLLAACVLFAIPALPQIPCPTLENQSVKCFPQLEEAPLSVTPVEIEEEFPECELPKAWWDQISGDPVADAAMANQQKHPKLLGVRGIALEAPGLGSTPYCLVENNRITPIKGTSDAICDKKHLEFNIKAYEYAAKFNEQLLAIRPSVTSPCVIEPPDDA